MNPEMEKELEIEISRALHGLPDLAAPPGLLRRTMATLEQPAPRPARSWASWPPPVRIAVFVFAIAAVAAAIVSWGAFVPVLAATATHHLAPAAAAVSGFWKFLSAIGGALMLAVEHLGKGFMLACLVAAAGACALCAGLGTVFVRLAAARPGRNSL
jgi:hypothetical protein